MQTQESKIDTGEAVNDDLVVIESSGTELEVQDDNNDTDANDAYIRPIYDEEPMAKDMVFAVVALKNDLRKLKGNSVDTKFAKISVLRKPVLQSLRNQSVVRQPNAFKSERPQISSKNSSKNMLRFSSNDMVHNYYLEEARKKTQKRNRNSKSNVMHTASPQNTTKALPKADHSKNASSFSDSKHFVCSTCHKCVFSANHDACITKLLKEVNSRAMIQSHKTRNSNKPIDQKSYTQKLGRHIFTEHRFSPNKILFVYEKTSPRSDLRWKPTGRIFKSVGLRWISKGKLFESCKSNDDNESTHCSNVDILNIHKSNQTLDLSVGTSINVQKEQSFDLRAGTSNNIKPDNLRVWLLKKLISHKPVLKWIQN
uniref:Uncharacterized protein n=1 Tax=Tanacetum cinerariifolium TaxID=118510 RepID=A0A6L2J2P1_TANCI|nr:hypothetical protein [Tanacetum cinerariifolium]